MRLSLIIAFLALPILEIALLIKTGQAIGFWATLALVAGTAIWGAAVIRREGFSAIDRFSQVSEQLARGEAPLAPVLDHMLMMTGGMLLIFPGILSDVTGALLLVPVVRRGIGRWFRSTYAMEAPFEAGARDTFEKKRGPVIDGEFSRLDD
jgi:UPF0716 protein FxsA